MKKEGERRGKEKSSIPYGDKGLSQSRLIACSRLSLSFFHPFAVTINFDSCYVYANPLSTASLPFHVPQFRSRQKTLGRFYDQTFQFRYFVPLSRDKCYLALHTSNKHRGLFVKIETYKLSCNLLAL